MEISAPDVVLPGRSASPTPVITPARQDSGAGPGVCSLCLSGPGKYTCPRCNAPYCSLACYKGPRHTACSELFYREAVLLALREDEAGPRGRKQMEDMLLRLREEEEAAEGRELDGEMNGEEAALWSTLTAQEKRHFTRLLHSGGIGALIPEWRPWWHPQEVRHRKVLELPHGPGCEKSEGEKASTNRKTPEDGPEPSAIIGGHGEGSSVHDQATVTAVPPPDSQGKTSEDGPDSSPNAHQIPATIHGEGLGAHDQSTVTAIPPVLSSIPPLCSLSRNPSPLVKYTLVNVIYGYAFSLLLHNGDVSDTLLDFTGTLLSVSAALSTHAVYNSTAQALKSAVRAASDPHIGGGRSLACSAMEATSHILQGDESQMYSLAALSHLCRLLGKVRKLVTGEKDIQKSAFIAKKKCLFLAAWVNEYKNCLVVLSREIMAEYKQYLDELSGVAEISRGLQKVWGGKRPPQKKKLVQEVDLPSSET